MRDRIEFQTEVFGLIVDVEAWLVASVPDSFKEQGEAGYAEVITVRHEGRDMQLDGIFDGKMNILEYIESEAFQANIKQGAEL